MSTNQKNPNTQNQGTPGQTPDMQGPGRQQSDGQQWNAQGSQQGPQRTDQQVSPYPRTQGQDGGSYPGLHGNQPQGAGVERDMQRTHPQGVAGEEERSGGGPARQDQEESGLGEHQDEQARDLHEEVQQGKPKSATQRDQQQPRKPQQGQQGKKGSRQRIEGPTSQPHTSHR
jgi:hypothetical protein